MRKFFILGKNAAARHIGMSVLIILQVICILAGSNILLASCQQQYILIKPFEKWLDSEGYYVTDPENRYTIPGVDSKPLLDSLQGEWECITYYRSADFNIYENNEMYPIKVYVYNNDFWDNYAPVMKSGRWQKSSSKDDAPWCAATPNMFGKELSLPGTDKKIKVKGVLGELCYIPEANRWSRNGSVKENFYKTFSSERDETIYVLMPESQWEQLGASHTELYPPYNAIIIPKRELTDEEKAYNDKIFKEFASPQLPMSTLDTRSRSELNDRLRRFLPLLIAQMTITLFGILCASAIQTFSDERVFSIYGLCGMNRKSRLMINLSEYGLLLFFSGAVTYIAYFITKLKGMHAKYGLLFSANNWILSAALIGLLLAVSLAAPFIITRNKRLADLLRRETE